YVVVHLDHLGVLPVTDRCHIFAVIAIVAFGIIVRIFLRIFIFGDWNKFFPETKWIGFVITVFAFGACLRQQVERIVVPVVPNMLVVRRRFASVVVVAGIFFLARFYDDINSFVTGEPVAILIAADDYRIG